MTDHGTNPPLSSPNPAGDEHDVERTRKKFLFLVIDRAVPKCSTVTELVPTLLGMLKPYAG